MSSTGAEDRFRPEATGYVDILQSVRQLGSLGFALRSRKFPENPSNRPERSAEQIIDDVLRSERVCEIVASEASNRGWPLEAVQLEARNIGTEMAHAFQLGAVRTLGFPLGYAFERMYTHIYTNGPEWERIRALSADRPVVFMPTHRSYLDFLLMSYLCFHFEVPLPAIAAGMDFMAMKLLGEMLRRSGAFFIRRSFGTDRLYWAVFTEYVQTQLRHADRTMEFFVEGTRSRTGKSLHPKYGLLTVLVEPYFRSQLYDTLIVPVSTCYERIIEESLYAYELIGFAKPKESTSGLLKARSVLETNYGQVVVHLGKPISVREFFANVSLSRNIHALEPNIKFGLTADETQGIRRLAHYIVKRQQANSFVNVWSLACVGLQLLLSNHLKQGGQLATLVGYDDLLAIVTRLVRLTRTFDSRLQLLHADSVEAELDHYLQLHDNVIEGFTGDGSRRMLRLLQPATVMQTKSSTQKAAPAISYATVDATVPRVIVGNYANQCLHVFADHSLLAGLLLAQCQNNSGTTTIQRRAAREQFCHLQSVFAHEFIHVPVVQQQHLVFDACVGHLVKLGALDPHGSLSDPDGSLTITDRDLLQFVYSLLEPYVMAYALLLDALVDHSATKFAEPDLLRHYQQKVERRLFNPSPVSRAHTHPYMLSTDIARNGLRMCRAAGAVVTDSNWLRVRGDRLTALKHQLEPLVQVLAVGSADTRTSSSSSKL